MEPILASVIGPDVLIVAGVIVLLFGGSQLPKLARSIGQAKQEFEKTQKNDDDDKPATPPPATPTNDSDR